MINLNEQTIVKSDIYNIIIGVYPRVLGLDIIMIPTLNYLIIKVIELLQKLQELAF